MYSSLHPADSIKFTSQGDYACSWCEYLIPVTNRKAGIYDLKEWLSAEVAGMFCSYSCAQGATNDITYRAKFGFDKKAI